MNLGLCTSALSKSMAQCSTLAFVQKISVNLWIYMSQENYGELRDYSRWDCPKGTLWRVLVLAYFLTEVTHSSRDVVFSIYGVSMVQFNSLNF